MGIAVGTVKGFPSPSHDCIIQDIKGSINGSTGSIQTTPMILNNTCTRAAFLDSELPTHEAISVVMVVPMFSPRTMAAAISNGSKPFRHIVNVSAIAALDDCINAVNTIP